MELLSYMKSYFGGLLTLGWSPDAKLIVTGGEDDLLTVYNVQEKRVVCRGQGHKSWISQVQFDPYMCTVDGEHELNGLGALDIGSDDEKIAHSTGIIQNGQDSNAPTPVIKPNVRRPPLQTSSFSRCSFASFGTINGTGRGCGGACCYRIGKCWHDLRKPVSCGHITEDM
ncbi:hypothetical protein COOONC_25918 [Cooperia oncophora]